MARVAACDAVHKAPDDYVCRISEQTRNGEQNALLHACITDVAEQMPWAGKKQDIETWKRLLVAAWMRATGRSVTLLPALDGSGFDALYTKTSRLTKAECAELTEYILAWGTDHGVMFSEPERV